MANNLKDERIILTNLKVTSRGFAILSWGILVLLLYRQFFLGQEFKDYGDIFLLWLAASAYVALGSTLKGVPVMGGRKANLWLAPLVMSFSILAVLYWRGQIASFPEAGLVLAVSFASAFALYWVLTRFYLRWEKRNLE